jgi:hypothetical protein
MFKCNKFSVLIILVLVPQPFLEMVSQNSFCHCLIKGEKAKLNETKQNTTKCPRFKCNTVSVSLSACRFSSVVFSSKVGRKKKRVWRQFCEWLSEAVAHMPAAVSLLFLEALFMQISGVS